MLRSSLLTASAVLLCASAPAQQQVQSHKIVSPIRDAGVYHVSTGTWTRSNSQANLGPDIIYTATTPSGYFGVGWEGAEGVDEGVLPSASNLNFPGASVAGAYTIDGFQFGYCANPNAAGIVWDFSFYASYAPCNQPDWPASCLDISGEVTCIPAPSATGGCWLVTVDLAGGNEICMETDGGLCNPGYQGEAGGLDHFGWGAVWNNGGQTAGPLLYGGDPIWNPGGFGTCYNTVQNCSGSAGNTGAGARNFFGIGFPLSGCYWFGGYANTNGCGGPQNIPFAQFYMQLFTDCTVDKVSCADYVCNQVICDNTGVQYGEMSIDSCSLCTSPTVTVRGLLGGAFSMIVVSEDASASLFPPGSQGTELCLGGGGFPIGRYNKDVADLLGGTVDMRTLNLETNNTGGGGFGLPNPPGGSIAVGQTLYFQNWTRVGSGDSRFSSGTAATFQI